MLRIDLQFFGGRGSSSGGGGGGGNTSSVNVKSTDSLVSAHASANPTARKYADEALEVFQQVNDEYGAVVEDIQIATLQGKGSKSVLAYYDSNDNIAVNSHYFNERMATSYAKSVQSGFHPSNGNKTAMQAVVAHELGHKLTYDIGTKLGQSGWGNFDAVADRIVREASGAKTKKALSAFRKKISGYGAKSNAEAIAEAFSDVYCNGKKASSASRSIVSVIDKYLK